MLEDDPAWHGARTGSVMVTLARGERSRRISLQLWTMGDELHGVWVHPDGKAEAWMMGRAWGLLSGTRGLGEPVPLVDGEAAPCMVCTEAFYTCGGQGPESCNSSMMAIDACAERLARARRASAPVPRGCGDWMSDGGA